jgi:hypothetical protein
MEEALVKIDRDIMIPLFRPDDSDVVISKDDTAGAKIKSSNQK